MTAPQDPESEAVRADGDWWEQIVGPGTEKTRDVLPAPGVARPQRPTTTPRRPHKDKSRDAPRSGGKGRTRAAKTEREPQTWRPSLADLALLALAVLVMLLVAAVLIG